MKVSATPALRIAGRCSRYCATATSGVDARIGLTQLVGKLRFSAPLCPASAVADRTPIPCPWTAKRVKRIGGQMLFLARLSLVVLILSIGRFLTPSLAEGSQVVDDFLWGQVKATGRVLALSKSGEALNYLEAGDLSPTSTSLVEDTLRSLSSATGVRIDREKNWSIAIFHDLQVFNRLKNDRPAFRAVGLPEFIIDQLAEKASDDAHCVTLTRTDDEMNVVLTIILSSQQADFARCLTGGLLNAFGIRAAETIDSSRLVSACVLYEARRASLRERQELSEQAAARFLNACAAKIERAK